MYFQRTANHYFILYYNIKDFAYGVVKKSPNYNCTAVLTISSLNFAHCFTNIAMAKFNDISAVQQSLQTGRKPTRTIVLNIAAAGWPTGRPYHGNSRSTVWKLSIKDLSCGDVVQLTRPAVHVPFGLTLRIAHVMVAGSQLGGRWHITSRLGISNVNKIKFPCGKFVVELHADFVKHFATRTDSDRKNNVALYSLHSELWRKTRININCSGLQSRFKYDRYRVKFCTQASIRHWVPIDWLIDK